MRASPFVLIVAAGAMSTLVACTCNGCPDTADETGNTTDTDTDTDSGDTDTDTDETGM